MYLEGSGAADSDEGFELKLKPVESILLLLLSIPTVLLGIFWGDISGFVEIAFRFF